MKTEATGPTKKDWGALAVLAASLGVIVLDGTIVGVALPKIIGDLQLTLTDAQWVNSLYAVIVGALLLASGSTADRVGRRTTLLIGMAIFVAGSAIAGVAGSATSLLAGRAVQAVGAAGIMPATLSTVNAIFRGKYRAAAFGVWGAVISGAAAIGPLLGGVLTEWVSWRWIFYVNLPIGALLAFFALRVVPQTKGDTGGRFDVFGFIISSLALGSLVFSIIEGPHVGWWKPTSDFDFLGFTWTPSSAISVVPISLTIAIVSLAVFIAWELHLARSGRRPLLDLSLFKIGTFSWGNLTAATVAIGEFALLFVLPLYLINAYGTSIIQAGLILAAMALGAFVSGGLARHVAGKLGSAGTVILGLALELVGVAALAYFMDPARSLLYLVAPLMLYGLGLGLASAQLTGTVLQGVPVGQSGQGSATHSTVRQVGSALGTAFSGGALAVGLSRASPNALDGLGLPDDAVTEIVEVTKASAGSNLPQARAEFGEGSEIMQALVEGFAQATQGSFWVSAGFLGIGFLGAVMVWNVARRES